MWGRYVRTTLKTIENRQWIYNLVSLLVVNLWKDLTLCAKCIYLLLLRMSQFMKCLCILFFHKNHIEDKDCNVQSYFFLLFIAAETTKNDCLGLSFIRKKLFTLLQCYVCQIKTHFAYRIIGLDRAAATWSLLPASMLCPVCASMWPLCEYWLCHVILLVGNVFMPLQSVPACLQYFFWIVRHMFICLSPPYPCCLFLSRKGKWSKTLQWGLFINYFGRLFILENDCFLLALQGLLF